MSRHRATLDPAGGATPPAGRASAPARSGTAAPTGKAGPTSEAGPGGTAGSASRAAATSVGARLDRLPVVRTHRTLTAVIGVGLFFDFFDSNLSGVIAKVLQLRFAMDPTTLKLVLAASFVGQFAGAVLLGRLADRIGRRPAVMLNLAVYSLFTLAGAFAPGAAWLVVTRFLAGVGIGAELALADSYLSEILPARSRGRMIAWAYTLAFCGVPAVGFAALYLTPRTVFGIAGWRWTFVLGAVGAAAVFLIRRTVVESPRWLAAKGRHAEADATVRRLEREAGLATEAPPSDAAQTVDRPTPLLRGPYLRRTLMLWVFSALSVIAYYGFGTLAPLVLAQKGFSVVASIGYVGVSFLGYPVGSALSIPLMERTQRKVLLSVAALAMAGCGLGFGLAGSTTVLVVFGFLYTLLSNVFANASHVFLAEQYPTRVRAGATGTAYALSRLSAAAVPFVLLPVLQRGGPGWLFTVIGIGVVILVADVLLLGDRTTGVSVDDRAPA